MTLQATRYGVVTRYIHNAAGNILAETDGSNITLYYIYEDGLIAAVTPTGEVYNYHFNGTGSTVAITDENENTVHKYAYTPFGRVVSSVGFQSFQFAGKYGVTYELNGIFYMKARYYDTNIGRFISEDPIGFEGGDVNLYAYVKNNPINFVDSNGLFVHKEIWNGIKAAGQFLADIVSDADVTIGIDAPFGGVENHATFWKCWRHYNHSKRSFL